MKTFYKKGFTAIEIVVVVAIMLILLGIVSFSFSGLKKSQALKDSVVNTLSSLDKSKSESFASVSSSVYGVHFQTDKIVIFKGTSYSSQSSSNENVSMTSPASITSINLSGGGSDLYFNRLTGVPSKTGTIIITSGTLTKTITISATGGISTN
jgi:prepilin-type N-terminal cleavage/methylation domain-containing protein